MACSRARRFAQVLMFAAALAVAWASCLDEASAQETRPRSGPPTNRAPLGYRAIQPAAPVNRAPGVPASAFSDASRASAAQSGRVPVISRSSSQPHRGVVIVVSGADRPRASDPRAEARSRGVVTPRPVVPSGPPRRRWQRPSRIPNLEPGVAEDARLGAEVRLPLARARLAFASVRYSEAIVELRQVLYVRPRSSDPRDGQAERRVARLGLGLAYLGLGRPRAAEVAFRAAVADDPDLRLTVWLETVYSFLPRPSIFESRGEEGEGAFLAAMRGLLAGDAAAAVRLLAAACDANPLDREVWQLLQAVAAHGGGEAAGLASSLLGKRSER